jgi:hypothetical protein
VDLLLWPIKMLIQSIFEEKKLGFNKQSRNMQEMDVEFKLYKINELKGYKLPP